MTCRRRPIHVITEVKETRGADADEVVQAPTKDETPYQEGMVFEASDVVGVPDDGGVESAEVFSGRRYQLSGSSPRHWPTGIAERDQLVSYSYSQIDALTMPSFLRNAFQNVLGKIDG